MARHTKIATLTMGYHTNADSQCRYRPSWGIPFGATVENNLSLLEAKILEAGRDLAADLVCFSEVALSLGLEGEEMRKSAVRVPGPEVERLAAAAKRADCYAVVGLMERAEPVGYNSAVLLGPAGDVVGVYRKVHITPGEHLDRVCPHTHGDSWPVFETRHGKVGIQICYDYYFPESTRCLALGGAEIVFSATMHDARGVEQMMALQKARAIDNGIYYVSSVTFCGGHEPHSPARSVIIDPVGVVRADSGFRDGWAVATVDLDDPFPQRWAGIPEPQNTRRMILKCRRPETYGAITAPKAPVPWAEIVLDGSQPGYPDI
jgi:predicted amidohydrolase